MMLQPARQPDGSDGPAGSAGPFPPDLHDLRHLWFKAALLLLWALVSFGVSYCARDLQTLALGGWPLGYWISAQGTMLVFIGIVVVYAWAMNRFERQDRQRRASGPQPPPDNADRPHG